MQTLEALCGKLAGHDVKLASHKESIEANQFIAGNRKRASGRRIPCIRYSIARRSRAITAGALL